MRPALPQSGDPSTDAAAWTRRIPAGAALAIALAFVVAVALAPIGAWRLYAGAAAGLLATTAAPRIRLRRLLGRLLLLEPFAIGVALLALAQPDGPARFTALLVRSNLCIAAMLLLGALVPFPRILDALRAARVPSLLGSTLALTHRYLFVLGDEMRRMTRARRSRTFVRTRAHAGRTSASVAAQLFVRSADRAARVHAAMCARGWTP